MERDQEAVAAMGGTDGTRANGASGSDHEIHKWTERERRKKMRHMFSALQALLPPQLPAKIDKSTIVDETVKYIKSLEDTLRTLEKQKLVMGMLPCRPINELDSKEASFGDYESSHAFSVPVNLHRSLPFPPPSCFQTWFSPNVVLTICGNEAHISVCSQKKPGLLPTIFYILQKHKLDVLSAHLSSHQCRCLYMINVIGGKASIGNPESQSVEETTKFAVREINFWVLTL